MNLVLIGPPGAGKGTQAKKIAAKYNIPHISTGDMFREASESGSALGKELQSYMSAGRLVPDELVIKLVMERLTRKDTEKGFLLDGFPRTIPQAEALDKALSLACKKIEKVVAIIVEDEEIVKRLASRRVCVACGATYNTITQPPKTNDICDACKGKVIQRADDNEATIRKRLSVYKEQTSPIIEYYSKTGIVRKVQGSGAVEGIFKAICESIEK
jgi:adenylate kinase